LDLDKYRALFLEETAEHLAEISRALLELEKDPARTDSIDVVFRMAHSIKGMAASLDYTSVAEVAHALEDRMQASRQAGSVGWETLACLFRGLEGLEAMLAAVRDSGQAPAGRPELVAALSAPGPREDRADAASAAAGRPEPAAPRLRPDPVEAPTPPPSVRVRTRILDRFLSTVGEVILSSNQLRTAASRGAEGPPRGLTPGLDRMDRVVGELQRRALELRTTPLARIVEPLPRMARELAQRMGKRVEVEILGAELELDRSILDRLSDPLVHLLRNAVDHGIEAPARRVEAGKDAIGRIWIEARRVKDSIRIGVRDDGAGIDLERVRERAVAAGLVLADLAEDLPPEQVAAFVFRAGLSTTDRVSEVSGRGVGMDAVRAAIESLGGEVELQTERGRGTATTLVVPITAAVQRVLLAAVGEEIVAIPVAKVERIVVVPAAEIERSGRDAFALVDGVPLPVLDLAEQIALPRSAVPESPEAILVIGEVRGERMGLRLSRVAGQQQIYVKAVPELLAGVKALAGLTILGDGRPVFLLDLNQLG